MLEAYDVFGHAADSHAEGTHPPYRTCRSEELNPTHGRLARPISVVPHRERRAAAGLYGLYGLGISTFVRANHVG